MLKYPYGEANILGGRAAGRIGLRNGGFPPVLSSVIRSDMDAEEAVRTYKIGQAAKLLDVKPFVLRFWESEFRQVLVPVRTPSGQRAYTEGNLVTVRRIKSLLYDEGLTIEGAKKRLLAESGAPGADSAADCAATPTKGLPGGSPSPMPEPKPAPQTALLRQVASELAALRDLLA